MELLFEYSTVAKKGTKLSKGSYEISDRLNAEIAQINNAFIMRNEGDGYNRDASYLSALSAHDQSQQNNYINL